LFAEKKFESSSTVSLTVFTLDSAGISEIDGVG